MADIWNWARGFHLSMGNPQEHPEVWTRRYLSQFPDFFSDREAARTILETEDPLIYEVQDMLPPSHPGDLAFGITRLYPGKIGKEYYRTKWHFHVIPDTAEIYYCLSGEGYLLTETKGGEVSLLPMKPSEAAYSARGYAHRCINTGTEPLIVFYAYRADAGHDYATIQDRGFHTLILEEDGRPSIQTNPSYSTLK